MGTSPSLAPPQVCFGPLHRHRRTEEQRTGSLCKPGWMMSHMMFCSKSRSHLCVQWSSHGVLVSKATPTRQASMTSTKEVGNTLKDTSRSLWCASCSPSQEKVPEGPWQSWRLHSHHSLTTHLSGVHRPVGWPLVSCNDPAPWARCLTCVPSNQIQWLHFSHVCRGHQHFVWQVVSGPLRPPGDYDFNISNVPDCAIVWQNIKRTSGLCIYKSYKSPARGGPHLHSLAVSASSGRVRQSHARWMACHLVQLPCSAIFS